MSRGGLLLRCVRENRELDYIEAANLASPASTRRRVVVKFDPEPKRPSVPEDLSK
jgi:hypothetical protein